ncbi:MAG: cupin domain-containing protein, partial [Oscillospiraceae bacterium]|nr:cupin domain-containing protein [Oscillospiraceae bacterium]
DYYRNTAFDNHYHDCDEYWIIVEGSGTVYSENKKYEVQAGDCVVTGMGHHHDFPVVDSHIYAVYFETTLGGE